jgi:hypothetical protein
MPSGAAYEAVVSTQTSAREARLCESAEAGFGNREVSAAVGRDLQLQHDYIRVDGMNHAILCIDGLVSFCYDGYVQYSLQFLLNAPLVAFQLMSTCY